MNRLSMPQEQYEKLKKTTPKVLARLEKTPGFSIILPPKNQDYVKKVRQDLVGTKWEYLLEDIANGSYPLYFTNNLVLRLPTPHTFTRGMNPELDKAIDEAIEETGVNLEPFNKKENLLTPIYHERVFKIYQRLLEKGWSIDALLR